MAIVATAALSIPVASFLYLRLNELDSYRWFEQR